MFAQAAPCILCAFQVLHKLWSTLISNTRPPAWYVGKLPNNHWGLTETGAQTNEVAVTCMTTHTVAYIRVPPAPGTRYAIANVSEARPLPVVVSWGGLGTRANTLLNDIN